MKKLIIDLGINLSILAGLILLFAVVTYFIWNTAVVWMIPALGPIGIPASLGVATLFTIVNNLIQYWINKYIEIKRIKALEALDIVLSLNQELGFIKAVLYEKSILNDIDFIAMESVKSRDAR